LGSSGGECEECKKKEMALQRSSSGLGGPDTVPAIVHDVLRSPGQPLDATTRAMMERRFGHDFSQVRIHADGKSAESTRETNALAYTVGRDVVFNTDQYQPQTETGQRLIAHELAHVVQHGRAEASGSGALRMGSRNDSSENEAERAANGMKTGSVVEVREASSGFLQRWGQDSSCKQGDLESHLWPGHALAVKMVGKAISALAITPRPAVVTNLLQRYFMTATPNFAEINRVYSVLKSVFERSDYNFSCKEDCTDAGGHQTLGITKVYLFFGPTGNVTLCMNNLRRLQVSETASAIIHEFGHRYAGLNDVDTYCAGGCPTDLKPEGALKNPDSYARFADEINSKSSYVKELKGTP
jgi:hypothetical protein